MSVYFCLMSWIIHDNTHVLMSDIAIILLININTLWTEMKKEVYCKGDRLLTGLTA